MLDLYICRDGRLQEGDQILAIDGQVLDSGISHQEAIHILQQAAGSVQLVVARGPQRAPATATHDDTTTDQPLQNQVGLWESLHVTIKWKTIKIG